MHASISTYMYIFKCMHTYSNYTCILKHIHIESNIYIYIQMYKCIFTHTHTHTHTPAPPPHPEEGMATYLSTHAWRTPWTEEPIGLQSMGPQRVGQDWNNVGRTHPWCHVSTIKIPVISLLNIVCPSCSSVPHPGSR